MKELFPTQGVYIQNDSGMDIPPYSVMVVTGVEITTNSEGQEGVAIRHVTQYAGQAGNILVNGPFPIKAAMLVNPDYEVESGDWWNPNNSYGMAFADDRLYVAIDQTVPMPKPGDEWGPVSGKWTIGPTGAGFLADGYPAGGGSSSSSSSSSSSIDWEPENVNTTRAIFARSGGVSKASGGDGGSGACLDCFDCIDATGATVVTCTATPNGATPTYVANTGIWDFSDSGGTLATTTFTYSGSGCVWLSEQVTLCETVTSSSSSSSSSSSVCGVYQLQFKFTTISGFGLVIQIFISFVSGTDWKATGS